jgi:hypothetical protein
MAKISHTELFWPQTSKPRRFQLIAPESRQGISERFPSLVESHFHHLEKRFRLAGQ